MASLQTILGNDRPLFVMNIREMERASGDAGIDTRLLADIVERAHEIMRSLGLDPADTTAEELYRGLNAAVSTGQANVLLRGSSYVIATVAGQRVSCNLQDVIENAHHELAFAARKFDHAERYLRAEIIKRYAEHERTEQTVIKHLAAQADIHRDEDNQHSVHPAEVAMSQKTQEIIVHGDRPSLLAIGDIFTDAFIKLNEHEARIDTDSDGSKRLSMPFGSKPPYDRADIVRAVGPSPNAAVACARLGLDVELMAFLGDDEPGKEALAYLHSENIRTGTVSVQKNMKSNYYYVLRYGADRTILVKNEAYDYAWQRPKSHPEWVYLSLLSDMSWQLHKDLLAYLKEFPDSKLAFQPGTFHFKWGAKKLADIYARSYIVVMNREEAVDVTGESYDSISALTKSLHALGPEIVVVTDGPNGSYASYDGKLVTIPNYPDPAPPLDRTGAGDAFASTIVAGLALGKSMDEALTWAPINSMSVVQQLGAQAGLLRLTDIKQYLEQAPETYGVREYKKT